ncbi:SH3-like domain-containing protein [Constrictibacter sp. MBR-5]
MTDPAGRRPISCRRRRAAAALLCTLLLGTIPAAPQAAAQSETSQSLPRFVSLKSDEARMRAGPGDQYPIEWVYRRRGLPVEVVAEFEHWRRVRAPDRTEGWMHRALLSAQRTIVIQGEIRTMHAEPATWAPPVARLEPGVIVDVQTCDQEWCHVSVAGREGWLRKVEGWGVYPDERIE